MPPQPTDWLLPSVPLGAGDEQYLFELVLRLKCMQEPVRIVAPALQVCVCVHVCVCLYVQVRACVLHV